jgi:hypothetical protein
VKVCDAAGRRVCALFAGWQDAGRRNLAWGGRDGDGRAVAVGLYFVRADAQGRSLTLRVARVR